MAFADLFIRIGVQAQDLQKGLQKTLSQVDKFSRSLKKAGRDMTQAFTVPLGGLAAAAFRFSKDATDAFTRFGQNVESSMGRLGDSIARALGLDELLQKLADGLNIAVDWFTSLDESTRKWIVGIAAAVAAAGPLILAIAAVVAGLTAMAGILTGPVGIILGIGGLVAASVSYGAHLEDLDRKQERFNQSLRDMAMAAEMRIEAPRLLEEQLAGQEKINQAMEEFGHLLKEAELVPPEIAGELMAIQDAADLIVGEARELPTAFEAALMAVEDRVRGAAAVFETLGGGVNLVEVELQGLTQVVEEFHGTTDPRLAQVKARIEALQTPTKVFMGLLEGIPQLAVQIGQGIFTVFQALTAGIGNAVAQALVFQENFARVVDQLWRQVIASVVSGLIQIGVQRLILAITNLAATTKEVSAQMAGAAATTYANAFSSISAIPIVGPFLAPGAAAAAVAGMLAGAAASAPLGAALGAAVTQLATGGLFMRPQFLVGEGGPEALLPLDRLEDMLNLTPREIVVHSHVHLDGKQIAQSVTRRQPHFLRLHGLRPVD